MSHGSIFQDSRPRNCVWLNHRAPYSCCKAPQCSHWRSGFTINLFELSVSKHAQAVWQAHRSRELKVHALSEIEQTAHVKQRRREIQCDTQMDLSLPVNQISGGGDVAAACLAYFPPFISQFILLGTLEVQYMKGVQPRLACHHKTAKKRQHSTRTRGWVESQHALLYAKREQR